MHELQKFQKTDMNSSEMQLTQFIAPKIQKVLSTLSDRNCTFFMASQLISESFDYSQVDVELGKVQQC